MGYKFYQAETANCYKQLAISNEQLANYKFLHDRVQQAAYSLIPEDQKQSTHLKIGQLLLSNTPEAEREEKIFEIVNQLNVGVELLAQQVERSGLAQLNLIAGRKARAATAYAAAVRYLKLGMELLARDSWQSQYELTLKLHEEAAEAEYLNTNFEESRKLAELAIQNAKNILDKVNIYEIQIKSYAVQNRIQEASNFGLQALKLLGVSLPSKLTILNVLFGVLQTSFILSIKQIEDLADLPEMTSPYKLAAMRILMTITPAAAQAGSLYFPLIILALTKLSVRYGNSTTAAFAYGMYGVMLCDKLGDIESGYRFGRLARLLLEQFNAKELKCKVNFLFNAMIRHWKEPLQQTITPLIETLHSGLEVGDLEYVSHCNNLYSNNLFLIGEQLELVEKNLVQSAELMKNLKLETAVLFTNVIRQTVLNFQGLSESRCSLIGEAFNEVKMLRLLGDNIYIRSIFYHSKTLLMYCFKDYYEAINNARLTEKSKETYPGFVYFAVNIF